MLGYSLMKPRSLRHRLEKAARLLVVIQKHMEDANAQFNEDKAEEGEVCVNCGDAYDPPKGFQKLGSDLEGRGYHFKRTDTPWLGLQVYRGKKEGHPDVLLQLNMKTNRTALAGNSEPHAYSFRNK